MTDPSNPTQPTGTPSPPADAAAQAAPAAPEPSAAPDPGQVADAPGTESPEAATPAAAPHDFGELSPTPAGGGGGSLNMLFDLMMPVSVELGRTAMTVREVLDLGRGSVIPLNRLAGEPIDIYVSDRKLAEGEVVVLGEHFGVRLTKVVNAGAVAGGGAMGGAEALAGARGI